MPAKIGRRYKLREHIGNRDQNLNLKAGDQAIVLAVEMNDLYRPPFVVVEIEDSEHGLRNWSCSPEEFDAYFEAI